MSNSNSNTVRAALVQSEWTGDKESMVEKNVGYARHAAEQGAQILCFQEIFNAPYFCNRQENEHFATAEAIPDGPTVSTMIELAKVRTGMVMVVPIFEREDTGHYYNTAAVIDADGTFLGKYRKTHILRSRVSGRSSTFDRATSGTPFSTLLSDGSASTSVTTATSRKDGGSSDWQAPKSCSIPSATTRGHSKYLWELEQPAAAVANEYFVGAINRVGSEDLDGTDYYGSSYFASPRGQIIEGTASDTEDEVLIRDLDMDQIEEVRHHWAFYRDRRPELYQTIAKV